MKNGEAAMAFASGYLFGRRHRTRWALGLAAMAAGKRLVSGRAPAGADQLTSELGKLGHDVGSRVVSAGRSAAMSAVSHRIDALSDRLEHRASQLRSGGPDGQKKSEEEPAAEDEERGEEKRGGKERGDKQRRSADRPASAQKRRTAGESGRRSRE